jgi:hypothetical protein
MFNPFTEIADGAEDAELVEKAKAGDREALEALILRHYPSQHVSGRQSVPHLAVSHHDEPCPEHETSWRGS